MKAFVLSLILFLALSSANSQTTYYFRSGNASNPGNWYNALSGGSAASDFLGNRATYIVPSGITAVFSTSVTFGSTSNNQTPAKFQVDGEVNVNSGIVVNFSTKNLAFALEINGTINFLGDGASQFTFTNSGTGSCTLTTTSGSVLNSADQQGIFNNSGSISLANLTVTSVTLNDATSYGFTRSGDQTLNLPIATKTSYSNITLSGSGTKTFATTNINLSGDLRISSGVIANIPGTPTASGVIVASKLYLNNVGVVNGLYGAASPATTIRTDYFSGTGYVSAQLSALPVTLSSFTAKQTTDNKVSLAWVTSSESVNKGFSIERQEEGSGKFQSLGFIASKAVGGNSQATLTYSFKDVTAKNGTNMYRLVQEDLDGKKTYSEVRVVKLSAQSVSNVFPNPSTGSINISRSNDGKKMNVQVLDQSGRVISQVNNIIDSNYRMNLPQSGIYSIKMMYPETGEQSIQRIVVQK